ncbi:MAG TPA: LPS assembly lipoprotein LptE [Opitutus sp.]|nr:LPS assembly lipoprotein LptE [Opitutus sp.]
MPSRLPYFSHPVPRLFRLLFPAAGLLFVTACSHYQLGTGGKLAFSTVYVAPARNTSRLPQAQAILTTQVREALAQDGRVALANSPQAADATLEIVIRDYHRDVASVRETDTGLARKFTLTLAVDCTLRDNRNGTVYFANRPIDTQRDAFVDGGQLQAEYQTVPLLAESIAKKITRAVLDVW